MKDKVRPVPGEAERFYVTSDSRPEVDHIVDVAYVECPGDMPRVVCSCERGMCYDEPCQHLIALAQWLKGQR